MARLANARNSHMTRWVIPTAKRLLIGEACKNMQTKPLAEVAHIEMGQSPSGESCNDNGDGIPLIGGPADLGLEFPQVTRWTNSPTKLCKSGDIIVCVRATIGEPRWANGVYCLGRGVAGISPLDYNLLPKFLFFIIEGNEQRLQDQGTGTTFKTISKQHLASIQVPMLPIEEQKTIVSFLEWLEQNSNTRPYFSEAPLLPASLSSQLRIIARIEELTARIEEARGLRREAIEERERLIALVVSDCFSIGAENGWKVGHLGEYVISDCYGTSEKTTDDESGTPIRRMGNIQNGRIDLRDLKYLHLSDKERTKLLLIHGDILVNRTNSAELVGKCAVFNLEGEYGFASYLIRLRLDITRVEPRLVATYINSLAGRAYMFNERKQMTGQANVNATKLKALPIALPSPAEQRDILDYLDNLQAMTGTLKQLQSETSAELDALLPSILDKAFKGEL